MCLGGYAGYGYLLVAVAVSLWWLAIALTGYWTADDRVWARKLFAFSIVAITALSVMMSIDFQVAPATHLNRLAVLRRHARKPRRSIGGAF